MAQSTDVSADSQKAEPPAPTEEIVVTGIQASQRKAIDAKLAAPGIADAIMQDDIGRLPDTTVVEAARRIPGVSVDLLTDSTRGRSEVQRASIRGFDAKYNTVTIDGSSIASIDSAALQNGQATRVVGLNLLPASLISELQVVKTITSDYSPNSLGGDINLSTVSAFTPEAPIFADFSAFGGVDTTSGDSISRRQPSGRASGIFTDRWEGNSGKLGLVLSSDYQHTSSASNGLTIGVPGAADQNGAGWTYYGANGKSVNSPALSTQGAVPTRFQVYSFDDDITHYSLSGKLEYDSRSWYKTSFFGGAYNQDSDETRNENLTVRTPSSIIAGNGTAGSGSPLILSPTTGSYSTSDGEIGVSDQPLRQNTEFLNWKNQFLLADDVTLDVDAAYSDAEAHLYRNRVKYSTNPTLPTPIKGTSPTDTTNMAFIYNISQFVPTIALKNPGFFENAQNFTGQYWNFIDSYETNQVIDLHPTLSWNAKPGSLGLGAKAGLGWVQSDVTYNQNYVEYDPTNPASANYSTAVLARNIPNPYWGGINMQLINVPLADQFLANNLSKFTRVNQQASSIGSDYEVNEDIKSGYVLGLYGAEDFHLEAGVRLERATDDLHNFQQVSNFTYQPVTGHSGYSSVLPSGLASYQITDDIVAHAGISQTVGRPDYSSYFGKVGQPSNGSIAVTLGNPDIEPRKTTNYDLSLDWYFDDFKSLVSAAFFHKDLKNEFYTVNFSAPYTYNSTTYLGNFSQTKNGASAGVNGLELNIAKDRLDFIPERFGTVGFNVNYTVIATDFTIFDATGHARTLHNLVNQPDYILNASLFYTYGDFNTALSYNRQGDALYQTGAYAWEDTYILARQQLDLTMRYQATKDAAVIVEASNLTGEPFVSALGSKHQLVADTYAIGRTLWLGVNYKF